MIKKVSAVLLMTVILSGVTGLAVNAENGEGTEAGFENYYNQELLETIEAGSDLEQLFEIKIKVDGKELSLPTDFKEIKALGWKLDKNHNDLTSIKYDKGNVSICAGTYYDSDVPLEELPVLSLGLSVSGIPDCEIELPGNIILGKSTTADVIEAYGTQSLQYMFADSRNKLDLFGIAYTIYNPLYRDKYVSFGWYGRSAPEGISINAINSVYLKNGKNTGIQYQ